MSALATPTDWSADQSDLPIVPFHVVVNGFLVKVAPVWEVLIPYENFNKASSGNDFCLSSVTTLLPGKPITLAGS